MRSRRSSLSNPNDSCPVIIPIQQEPNMAPVKSSIDARPVTRWSKQDGQLLGQLVHAGALSRAEAKKLRNPDELCRYARETFGHP